MGKKWAFDDYFRIFFFNIFPVKYTLWHPRETILIDVTTYSYSEKSRNMSQFASDFLYYQKPTTHGTSRSPKLIRSNMSFSSNYAILIVQNFYFYNTNLLWPDAHLEATNFLYGLFNMGLFVGFYVDISL